MSVDAPDQLTSGSGVPSVCVASRVVVTTSSRTEFPTMLYFRTAASETSQQRLGARRAEETGRPSGSSDPWVATVKIGSSSWAEGRVLGVVTLRVAGSPCLPSHPCGGHDVQVRLLSSGKAHAGRRRRGGGCKRRYLSTNIMDSSTLADLTGATGGTGTIGGTSAPNGGAKGADTTSS
ncbi:hypothetical protein Taro_029654 [Colocasia esculenta]|uniref:Uncharacterized protein n=1 Tax=Colocasia esculenta TaxID=4460 RepID=A0A843VEC5_COLES|nr:hypothetical protein [Colocasia esculenta]